ncbi:MAG: hypothetical protein AAF581_08540 [Planctomycetota bacterium]
MPGPAHDPVPPQLPQQILALIDEAEDRIREHLRRTKGRRRGFVASDFVAVYQALRHVVDSHQASGDRFCEWGSGFGVVALLAHALGFHSSGIEIQEELVEQAEQLAHDFEMEVDYVVGSFVPVAARSLVEEHGYTWSDPGDRCGYEELDAEPEDFDLFFAYPWPGEEDVFDALFAQCAATGTLLLTYNGVSGVRLQRKLEDGSVAELDLAT